MTTADARVRNTKVASSRTCFVTDTDPNVVMACEEETDDQNSPGVPFMIRSAARLNRRRVPASISVDQLEPHERDLYLRDYLPPNPDIRRKPAKRHVIHARQIDVRRKPALKYVIHARQIQSFSARDKNTCPAVPTLTCGSRKTCFELTPKGMVALFNL
jgi:hypothetical protein